MTIAELLGGIQAENAAIEAKVSFRRKHHSSESFTVYYHGEIFTVYYDGDQLVLNRDTDPISG